MSVTKQSCVSLQALVWYRTDSLSLYFSYFDWRTEHALWSCFLEEKESENKHIINKKQKIKNGAFMIS